MRSLFTIWFCLFFFSGCSKAPTRVVPEAPASNSAEAAVELCDADKDGLLSEMELLKAPGLKSGLKQADADLDGKLSASEINGRIAAWTKTKVARMPLVVIVTRRGMPLVDAEVRVIPESFQGTALPIGAAKTNGQGLATPTAPVSEEKPSGLPPGYYRIEIQSASGDLPASYNSATTLGVEMATDSTIMAGPVRIEIP